MQRILGLVIVMTFLAQGGVSQAEVGDVLLSTNHPHYPGEGALQTPEDCVRFATRGATTHHDRSIAIFHWLLTHQWHLHSPQEWCQIGRQPGASNSDYEMVVYDANKGRFSYGYGLCGTVHAWNEAYWGAAGYRARRRAFPGHSNSEVFVDGKWRMFDTDMAGIVIDRDGNVAGYDEIAGDLSLLEHEQDGLPRYPFAWPADFETMKAGWEKVAAGGNWYKLYHGGYAAQPPIVHLRAGESFTRYPHPDAFGGIAKRRFWHQQENGPSRVWTFANQGTPVHHRDESNCRGPARFGNAVFDYRPDLTQASCLEGVTGDSSDVSITPRGLRTADGRDGVAIVFEHFSPYVICGDPVDDKDPMQNQASDGFVIECKTDGVVVFEVSGDQGQTWHAVGTAEGQHRFDATERVKGRYGWQMRVTICKDAVLHRLRFVTTGQLCETIYPRLKPNGTTVSYRSKSRAVTPVLPLLVSEAATAEYCEKPELRSPNLEFLGRSAEQRMAYRVRGAQRAHVVFRIPARTPLMGVSAAARFAVRSPTPPGAKFGLDYSTDGGQTWDKLGTADPPPDNEFSSGWVYGNKNFPEPVDQSVLVRVTLNGGGYGTGLLTTELYGLRQTSQSSALKVTYGWREDDKRKQHSFVVAKGRAEQIEEIHGLFYLALNTLRGFRSRSWRITMLVMNRLVLLLFAAAALLTSAHACGDEAAENLMLATYKLANESSTATGIAVHRVNNGSFQRFVVTANHVLEQMKGDSCILVSRLREESGIYRRNEIQIAIRADGKPLWKGDKANDVAALPLPSEVSVVTVPYECLATEQAMEGVRAGDQVVAAVFPERTEANNAGFPILRGGTIASYPLRPINSHATFLVDANTWKGDSGSAVAHRSIHHQEQWPLIIGVTRGMQNITDSVNESRFVLRRTDYPLGVSVVGQAAFARRLIEQ